MAQHGINEVAGFVRDLRTTIAKGLLKGAKIKCGDEDVVCTTPVGYKLSEKLSVEQIDGGEGNHERCHESVSPMLNDPNRDTDDDTDEPVVDTDEPDREPANELDDTDETAAKPLLVKTWSMTERRKWIVEHLTNGRKLRVAQVIEELKCSESTAKRDLNALKDDNVIEWVGSTRNGSYQLKESSDAASSDR